MTNFAMTANRPNPADVIGPYSPWPRQPQKKWKTPVALSVTVATAGIFAHCVAPTLF